MFADLEGTPVSIETPKQSAVDPILGVLGLGVGRWKELGMKASLPQLALPLALGLCAPDVLEFAFGFGSRLNMLGRSVLVPVVWLKLRNQKQAPLRWALAVTAGLVVHLLMAAQSGATPFARSGACPAGCTPTPPWAQGYCSSGSRRRTRGRRRCQSPRPENSRAGR